LYSQRWVVDINFIKRRIEEHRARNKGLDEEMLKIEEALIRRDTEVKELEFRVKKLGRGEAKGREVDEKRKKLGVFVEFLGDKFGEMKDDLANLVDMSVQGEQGDQLLEGLKEFIECVNHINTNLDDYCC
jgi:predicted nuclease with TOPRIM domain